MKRFILDRSLLDRGDHVIAGVSGGADSVAMLRTLAGLRAELGLGLTAVHINHNLRGAQSDADELFVKDLCEALNVSFISVSADVPGYSKQNKISVEDAGRRLRYMHFENIRAELSAQKIAVAHNKDDNAETVLMNLCRGAGLAGVCGITARRGAVVRPALCLTRAQITGWLHDNDFAYRTDESNTDSSYTRNFLRGGVMKELARRFGSGVCETVARGSSLLQADEEYLREQASLALKKSSVVKKGAVALKTDALLSLHEAILGRALHAALCEAAGGPSGIGQNHVDLLKRLLANRSGKGLDMPGGVRAEIEYGFLLLRRRIEKKSGAFYYPLILNSDEPLYIPETGTCMRAVLENENEPQYDRPVTNKICTIVLNRDTIADTLCVRSRRPGDTVFIAGVGRKKLQDFFIDKKIPRDERDAAALIASGADVLFIFGMSGISAVQAGAPGGKKITVYAGE
ncbi:MAG: tRNA lysidine(34) synthetase TilS [Defluviitaleaceae bacterium]|nr:tRNA lysidine(34) synthetase TilS [Defluviitaleaceae bacterium]